MICPKCGSRDVLDTSDADRGIRYCGCENCGHQWSQRYDYTSASVQYPGEKKSEGTEDRSYVNTIKED